MWTGVWDIYNIGTQGYVLSLNQFIHSVFLKSVDLTVQWPTANKAFNDNSELLVRTEGESSWSKSYTTVSAYLTFESIL